MMLDANSDICDADAHDTDLNCHIPVDEASLQRCVAWRVRKKAFSCTSRRLRQNADLRNGRNSPRSRAAQREATVCHVCLDDARGCDISSIISVSTTSLGRDAPPLCSVGGLWLQQELILVRRNGEWIHPKNRRGPPWGGARSRLARSLAVYPFGMTPNSAPTF